MTKETTSIEHIDNIIAQINGLIEKKEDFTAFILIALGIEYLGSFFDSKPFFECGQSEIRFNNGIDLFKNKWYSNNKQWLYRNFRGPLVHQFWTGTEILLTSNCKNKAPLKVHLETNNNKRIFVLEKLFEDFKVAALTLKNLSQKENSLNKEKLKEIYAEIILTSVDNNDFFSSGKTLIHRENTEIVAERKKTIRENIKRKKY
jgi:hypothetical protein